MPESPAYAHREVLLSTISLHHHWAQLKHSACGAARLGTTGAVSGAVGGAVSGTVGTAGALRIVYISFSGVAPSGTGEGGTRGTPAPANASTPCPEVAATWPGDSGCGTSGTSVPAIAPVTPGGALGVMITGANGGIPRGAKAKLPGGTTTVCPPEVNATFPEFPMFATPVPPACSSII